MKKVFFVLLAINIVFALVMNAQTRQSQSVVRMVDPEKIIQLPDSVDCYVWGNFSQENLQSIENALDQLELQRAYKRVPAETIFKYWVHTLPFPNRQAAEREINKLRNMGIISYRVQEDGEWLNAISFGEFKNRSTAQKLLENLKEKNETNALILERNIEQKKYLIFDTDPNKIAELNHLAEQFANSNLEQSACERL